MSQYNQTTDGLPPTFTHNETNSDVKNEMCTTQVKLWSEKMTAELNQEMNHIEFLRLRNLMVEYVEELKLRRHNDIENEERIRHLVQEKYELERKCDNEKNKYSLLEEQHRKVTMETKRKFEERIQVLEEESKQNQVHRDCNVRETKALKDEIHNLQLAKYSLEKKLHDQERKLKLQLSSSEQHLGQLSKVDQKFNVLTTYCKQLVDSQSHLDKNVKEAVKLNQVLMYVNEHQKCVVEQQRNDITKLQDQMVKLKAENQAKPTENNYIKYEQDLDRLKKQLKLLEAENDSLRKENSDLISKHQTGIEKLEDAHRLIERHLKNAELHKKEAITNFKNYKDSERQLNELKQAMDKVNKELQIQISLHEESVDKWKIQEKTWNDEMDELKTELKKNQTACKELEELNTTWAKQNMDISQCLKEARKRLDIDKSDSTDQTDLCMLYMIDIECQVTAEIQSAEIQTDSPVAMTTQCQICPDTRTMYTQTVVVPVTNKDTQTVTLTQSESHTDKGESCRVQGSLHDMDKNTHSSGNNYAKTPNQTVQQVKGHIMEDVKGQTPCSQIVQEVKGQQMKDDKDYPVTHLPQDFYNNPCQSSLSNLAKSNNDEGLHFAKVQDLKTLSLKYAPGKMDSSDNENVKSKRNRSEENMCMTKRKEQDADLMKMNMSMTKRKEEGEDLMKIKQRDIMDKKMSIPPTQDKLPSVRDLNSIKPGSTKTTGKRRLYSMDQKMVDQVNTSPLSSSYQPDVSSLWKNSAKSNVPNQLQFVDMSNVSNHGNCLADHNDHTLKVSRHMNAEDETGKETSLLSCQAEKQDRWLGRNTSQNKRLSLRNINKSSVFMPKSISLITTENPTTQNNLQHAMETKENLQNIKDHNVSSNFQTRHQVPENNDKKQSFRLLESTPVLNNPLSNQPLENQALMGGQSNLFHGWSEPRQQGDSQLEARSSSFLQYDNHSDVWSRTSQQYDSQLQSRSSSNQQYDCQSEASSRSSQQCDSQSDLSPYSRYSAKLRCMASTTSVLFSESQSLNSSQKEILTSDPSSISKHVVREITTEENQFTTKSILKETSFTDARQKQSKNVQFSEDIVLVSPVQSQLSGDQCLFSDPEDEAGSQTSTDTPIQQESPVVIKKPKLSKE